MSVTTIRLSKAEPLAEQAVPDLFIEVTLPVPPSTGFADQRQVYCEQAGLLATTLLGSLPGGTIDALLIALLESRASVLRIPYASLGRTAQPPNVERLKENDALALECVLFAAEALLMDARDQGRDDCMDDLVGEEYIERLRQAVHHARLKCPPPHFRSTR